MFSLIGPGFGAFLLLTRKQQHANLLPRLAIPGASEFAAGSHSFIIDPRVRDFFTVFGSQVVIDLSLVAGTLAATRALPGFEVRAEEVAFNA